MFENKSGPMRSPRASSWAIQCSWREEPAARFLTIYTEAPKAKAGLVIVHGIGVHPDWGLICTLRGALADHGYTTLSAQIPVLAQQAEPEEYRSTLGEAGERLKVTVDFLRAKGYTKIAIGRVEDERGGVQDRRRLLRAASFVVALAEKSIAPFLLPAHRTGRDHFGHPALGRVSRAAFAAASRGSRSRARTPSSPNTAATGNCRYPGPASLCRRRRKRRTE